jgi:hypothetical protein
MTYQLRKTAQGLMLYGSEMEKPTEEQYSNLAGHPIVYLNKMTKYLYSFQPICPIHKEHEIAFKTTADTEFSRTNSRGSDIYEANFAACLEQGIEIPSERVGFVKDEDDGPSGWGGLTKQYAILLPEKKEEEIIKTYTEADLRAAFGKGYTRGYRQRDCEENYNPITGFEPKNKEVTFEEFIKSLK